MKILLKIAKMQKDAGVVVSLNGYKREKIDNEKGGVGFLEYEEEAVIDTPSQNIGRIDEGKVLAEIVQKSPKLKQMTTDKMYAGPSGPDKKLSKQDVQQIISEVKKISKNLQEENPEHKQGYEKGEEKIIEDARHIIRHPEFKFARLEYR